MGKRWKSGLQYGFILLFVMSSLLAACSSGGSGTGSTGSGSSSGQGSTSKSTSTPAPEKPKKISFLLVNNAAYEELEENEYVDHLRELSGYDLTYEFLPGGEQTTQQLALRFAAGDLPDVVRTTEINAPVHAGAVDQGAFHDLTDLIDQYAPTLKQAIPDVVWKSPQVSKDGKIYGIPAMWPNPNTRVIYYRQDWLEQAGMKELKTLDDVLAFFEYVKNNDMNGDGDNTDEVGFMVREQMSYSDVFFGSFGAHPTMWVMRDGEFIPSMITQEMKEAVGFWKQLYDKGYINQNMFTNKAGDWDGAIRSNKAAMWMHDAANYSGWSHSFTDDPADTSIIGYMPAPEGPNGHAYIRGQRSGIYFVHVIPSKTENVEDILKYFEWVYTNPDAQDFFHYGIEGVNWKREGTAVSFDGVPKPLTELEDRDKQRFQLVYNPQGVGYEDDEILALSPVGDIIMQGFEMAEKSAMPDESLYLPVFELMTQRPELRPATTTGSMFMDMFAKAITGREPIDTAFDSFVNEWKSRGGDQLIQEATEWHKSFYGQ